MEWQRFEISTVGNGENRKRGITLEKIKISKKNNNIFLRVISRVLCPNFKFLAQTVSAVSMAPTDRQTDRQTHIVTNQTVRKAYFTSDFLCQCFVLIGLVWK